ncbi:predicted protein [Uncinocarpus reesii 1704]|uniref:Stc1 domain-containing protein n=1 Tax=Uncinocarpus reesii (strain UAMH 1704) TaxID=336963 RepID=C4JV70_UNCRE|nr:uncharacterized protein UREG_06462 [Uncinocarpus reesii 1704]EEP81597.1 predicted protein [Uncinocarpus reesii 1704]
MGSPRNPSLFSFQPPLHSSSLLLQSSLHQQLIDIACYLRESVFQRSEYFEQRQFSDGSSARTNLGKRVKCKICKKIRSANAFSKRQLEELRKAMLKHGATGLNGPGYAGCRACITHQVVELTCCVCDKTKALEFFSKNQRRDPDSARCTNCVQGQMDTEPVMDDAKLLLDDESAIDTNTYMSQSDAYTINSFRTLSIAGGDNLLSGSNSVVMSDHTVKLSYQAPSNAMSKGKGKEENASLGGGVWLEQGSRFPEEMMGPNATGGVPLTQGNAHLRIAAPPSEAAENSLANGARDAWKTASSVRSQQSVQPSGMVIAKRTSNFAKIPAAQLPKEQKPNMYKDEPEGETIESDESSFEDDDVQTWI